MMMIIITRYPASEDRLIVRPLLSRVCALRLQPAEPQPYSWSTAAATAMTTAPSTAANVSRGMDIAPGQSNCFGVQTCRAACATLAAVVMV